jgi:hypothetical protein
MTAMPDDALHCLRCGYNLTGLTDQRCPEWGRLFYPAEYGWHREQAQSAFSMSRMWFVLKPVVGLSLIQCALNAVMYLLDHDVAAWILVNVLFLVSAICWGVDRAVHAADQWAEHDRFIHRKGSSLRFMQRLGIIAGYTLLIGTLLSLVVIACFGVAQGSIDRR